MRFTNERWLGETKLTVDRGSNEYEPTVRIYMQLLLTKLWELRNVRQALISLLIVNIIIIVARIKCPQIDMCVCACEAHGLCQIHA